MAEVPDAFYKNKVVEVLDSFLQSGWGTWCFSTKWLRCSTLFYKVVDVLDAFLQCGWDAQCFSTKWLRCLTLFYKVAETLEVFLQSGWDASTKNPNLCWQCHLTSSSTRGPADSSDLAETATTTQPTSSTTSHATTLTANRHSWGKVARVLPDSK